MKAIEYLTIKLEQLALKFDDIQIRYEFRINTNSHLIEIIPSSFFEKNALYLIEEGLIEDEFERLFTNENIVFITEGSLTEIKSANYTFGYNKVTFQWEQPSIEYVVTEGYTETVVVPSEEDNYALAA